MALQELKFTPGISADDTPSASEGTWIDADKVRFVRGKPQLLGGWESVTLDKITGVCRSIHTWANNAGSPQIALGTHSHLFAYSGGGLYDITPTGLAAGLQDSIGGAGFGTGVFGSGVFGENNYTDDYWPRTWSMAQWGEHLVASPRNGKIYEWDLGTTTKAVEVTGAPARVGSIFVTPERILVAAGSIDFGGTWAPMTVRWSNQEDNSDWTPSALNQSGEYPLASGSRIVCGMASRAENLVWTDTSLYSMQYLGDPLLVFGFTLKGTGCGLLGPNAVSVINGMAFWAGTNGQFYLYDGGVPKPVDCPVRREIFDNLSWVQQDKVVVSSISGRNEFIILYPDARDGNECSRYALFNYVENTWTLGKWDRTAWVDASPEPWPVSTSLTGSIYYHEKGTSADGGPITGYLLSSPIDLADGEQLCSVTRIVPDFEDLQGGLTVSLLTRMWPSEDAEVKYSGEVNPSTEKLDCRITARSVAIRIDSTSAPSFWRMGAPRLDIRETGSRR